VDLDMNKTNTTKPGTTAGAATPRVVRLFVPANIDLTSLRASWREYALWIVDFLVWHNRHDRRCRGDVPIPLDSRLIKRCVPAAVYSKVLKWLEESEIIERVGTYRPAALSRGRKGRCQHYRLLSPYREAALERRVVVNKKVVRGFTTARACASGGKADGGTQRLKGHEKACRTDAADAELLAALRALLGRVDVQSTAPVGECDDLDALRTGNPNLVRDRYGRVHSSITRLKKECREYVGIRDSDGISVLPLYAVDVTSCVYLLLVPLIKLMTGEAEPLLWSILAVLQADCEAGRFYEKLAAEAQLDRDKTKRALWAVFFGPPRYFGPVVERVREAVNRLYPGLLTHVRALHERLPPNGLMHELQRLESKVMIDRVAVRLINKRPEVPFLTIHDAILVPRKYLDVVEQAIREEWWDAFKLRPKLKSPRWSRNPTPNDTRPRSRTVAT
jgi:hypothetical protein